MVDKTRILSSAINCDVNTLYDCLCKGESVNTLTDNRVNLLSYAIIFNNNEAKKKEYIDYLILNEIDINNQDCLGRTALHLACLKSDLETVKQLINNSCYINIVDNEGNNELMSACRTEFSYFKYELNNLMISQQDINYVNAVMNEICKDKNKTDKMLKNQLDIIKLLLECGIYKYQVSNNGYTAMDLAINNFKIKTTDMVKLLKEYSVPTCQQYDESFNAFSKLVSGGITGLVNDSKVYNIKKEKIKVLKQQ